jgi:hypothetical protein
LTSFIDHAFQPRHRGHGAAAHLVGLAGRDREAAEDPERVQTATLGERAIHHHARGRAVGELARVAGRNRAFLAAHWRQLREAFPTQTRVPVVISRWEEVLIPYSPSRCTYRVAPTA